MPKLVEVTLKWEGDTEYTMTRTEFEQMVNCIALDSMVGMGREEVFNKYFECEEVGEMVK